MRRIRYKFSLDVCVASIILIWHVMLFFSLIPNSVGFHFKEIHEGGWLWINAAGCFVVFTISSCYKFKISAIFSFAFGLVSVVLANARILFK